MILLLTLTKVHMTLLITLINEIITLLVSTPEPSSRGYKAQGFKEWGLLRYLGTI